MKGKVVLITGGSSGIGKSIGQYLISKGHVVYGTTRNLQKHRGFDAFELLEMDVRRHETIQSTVQHILKTEGRLDVLINNAGVGITGPIEETPNEEIAKAFNTNFFGCLNMIKVVLPTMRAQKSGLIINITSIAGYMGLPYRGIYSATKGAMELTTEALRMETKDFGIHLTNLAPGDFATDIASGRFHSPVLPESPYHVAYSKTLRQIDAGVQHGEDPIRVARKVLSIMNTDRPKIHYKVGSFLQRFSLILKKILPDKVYEKLLLNHYKL